MALTPFWVYSVGDATMLTNAFVGVALVFNNGDDIKSVVAMGLMFSLIMLGVRAVATQRLDLEYFFYGLILYMALFVPKVDVHVEDTYTASGTTVSNIPLGLAVPMSIVTRLGHYFTVTYETAFSVPSMSNKGYLDALNIIARLDGIGTGSANSDSTISGDLRATIVSYISECAIYDAMNPSDEQEVTWEKIRKATDTWGALETNFVSRYVDTFIPGVDPASGASRSCKDAYIAISNYLNGSFITDWNSHLKYILKKDDPVSAVEDAMTALGTFSISSQEFMMNSLVRTLVREGSSTYSASAAQTGAAAIRTQAMEQRKYQWATEQTLFKEVARPLMAFIESFVVCLAPIMCFLITLGPMGIQLAGKYFLSVVWVSLWGPVMSLVNTYIHLAAAKDVADYTFTGADPTTMMGMESLYTTIGTWVATGGLLAASVPALSLTLVYGGAVTASALASRMQGGDHVNEKIARPDLHSPGAVTQGTSQTTFSAKWGRIATGGETSMDSINFGSTLQQGLTASTSAMNQWSRTISGTFGNDLSRGINKTVADGSSRAFMTSATKSLNDTEQKTLQNVEGKVREWASSKQEADQVMAKLGTSMAAGLKVLGMGADAVFGKDSSVAKRYATDEAFRKNFNSTMAEMNSLSSSFVKASTSSEGRTVMDTLTKSLQNQDKASFADAHTKLTQAAQQVVDSQTALGQMGASGSMPLNHYASHLISSGRGEEAVALARSLGPKVAQHQATAAAKYAREWGIDAGQARVMGAIAALNGAAATNDAALQGMVSFNSTVSGIAPGEFRAPSADAGFDTGALKAGVDQRAAAVLARTTASAAKAAEAAPYTRGPDPNAPLQVVTGKDPLTGGPAGFHTPSASNVGPTEEERKLAQQWQAAPLAESRVDNLVSGTADQIASTLAQAPALAMQATEVPGKVGENTANGLVNVYENVTGTEVSPETRAALVTFGGVAGTAAGVGGAAGAVKAGVKKFKNFRTSKKMEQAKFDDFEKNGAAKQAMNQEKIDNWLKNKTQQQVPNSKVPKILQP